MRNAHTATTRRLLRMLEGASYMVTAVSQEDNTVLYQNDASARYHGDRMGDPSMQTTSGSVLSDLFSMEGFAAEQVSSILAHKPQMIPVCI